MKLRRHYEAKRLTRELQEIGFVAEDQVVVGNEVEEPDVQLLRVMALEVNNRKRVLGRKRTKLFTRKKRQPCSDLRSAEEPDHADARGRQLSTGHALKVGAHAHLAQVLQTLHLVHLGAHQHGHGLQHAGWKRERVKGNPSVTNRRVTAGALESARNPRGIKSWQTVAPSYD